MVASMELAVLDSSMPPMVRFIIWLKLVRIWAALRSDDLQGIIPDLLKLLPSGLTGYLDRSKTSGPGRKNRWLLFYVSVECFVTKKEWLEEGF
eukprot:2573796-Karenia_brevis.AAC.1